MKKIKLLLILSVVLLSTASSFARPAPNGVGNYVSGGHLYVWYNTSYIDMGPFVQVP